MPINEYELELYFNSLDNKEPSFYRMESFDTNGWTDDEKRILNDLIIKWNDRMSMMNSALSFKDQGISTIVSEPYVVTRQLRNKESLEHKAEWHRRRAEYYDMLAEYEGSNVQD